VYYNWASLPVYLQALTGAKLRDANRHSVRTGLSLLSTVVNSSVSDTKNNTEWTPPKIAVQPTSINANNQAADVLAFLRTHSDTQDAVLIDSEAAKTREFDEHWRLLIGEELPRIQRPDGVNWCLDFRSAKTLRRAAENNRAQQPLARALGLSKLPKEQRHAWHVVDGTAGAGADGWQIAAAGASVTWVEQHPVLFTLLSSALGVAAQSDSTSAIAKHIQVLNDNIENVLLDQLNTLSSPIHAIYLDPMYPVRRSKAAVKKPMQFIQALVGKGPAPEKMLQRCLEAMHRHDLKRVVVKRPTEAAPLITELPSGVQQVAVDAGAARFDVYLMP